MGPTTPTTPFTIGSGEGPDYFIKMASSSRIDFMHLVTLPCKYLLGDGRRRKERGNKEERERGW